VLAQLMHAATFGAYHAAALGMVNTWFPDSMRSRGQALYMSLSFGAGGMIGGIGSGFLWQSVGPGWTLTGSSLVCLLGLVLALRSGSAPAREQT
jgi:PPP family 3-phenylpropionic acid transporter